MHASDVQEVMKRVESLNEAGAKERIDALVPELNQKIRAFVAGWNDRCHTFEWTNPSTEILRKANRSTTLKTAH